MFLDGEAGKEFALIKGRKGFVRAAMAHGVPLVPVYGEQFVCSLPARPLEGGWEGGEVIGQPPSVGIGGPPFAEQAYRCSLGWIWAKKTHRLGSPTSVV